MKHFTDLTDKQLKKLFFKKLKKLRSMYRALRKLEKEVEDIKVEQRRRSL